MIKMVVTDIDGTIYSPQTGITEEVKTCIHNLIDNGVHVAIATGRNFGSTKTIADERIANLSPYFLRLPITYPLNINSSITAATTTTLKMLTGSLSINEGSIKINGYDITQDSVKAKKEFGFVPDSPDIFLKLSGIEYLHFLATIYGLEKDYAKERIDLLSSKFDMKEDLLSKIETYSHGMRQKIIIMGALIGVWGSLMSVRKFLKH